MPEIQVSGRVTVTAIDDCPEILKGDGSVVTGRFITREVSTIARVEILGPDGTIETLEGTPIHPIWYLDREDWVPLGELVPGDQLATPNDPPTMFATQPHPQRTHHLLKIGVMHIVELGNALTMAESCRSAF